MSITGEKADDVRSSLFGDGTEDRFQLIYIVTGVTSSVSVQERYCFIVHGGAQAGIEADEEGPTTLFSIRPDLPPRIDSNSLPKSVIVGIREALDLVWAEAEGWDMRTPRQGVTGRCESGRG